MILLNNIVFIIASTDSKDFVGFHTHSNVTSILCCECDACIVMRMAVFLLTGPVLGFYKDILTPSS